MLNVGGSWLVSAVESAGKASRHEYSGERGWNGRSKSSLATLSLFTYKLGLPVSNISRFPLPSMIPLMEKKVGSEDVSLGDGRGAREMGGGQVRWEGGKRDGSGGCG